MLVPLPPRVVKAKTPVRVYYQLTDFHQNHRLYVASVCLPQLDSLWYMSSAQLEACLPSDDPSVHPVRGNGSHADDILWPVGRMARSFFTDHFELLSGGHLNEADLVRPSVSQWFRNPRDYPQQLNNNTEYLFQEFSSSSYDFYSSGVRNPHFMAWMQPQAFPNFRKLFGTIEADSQWPANVSLLFRVRSGFDVESFGGTKGIVVASDSWTGALNPYLAALYLATGSTFIILAGVLGGIQLCCSRKMGQPLRSASGYSLRL